MAVSLTNGNGKDFFFTFITSYCQDGFLGGPEESYNLNYNFVVSNIVVELF